MQYGPGVYVEDIDTLLQAFAEWRLNNFAPHLMPKEEDILDRDPAWSNSLLVLLNLFRYHEDKLGKGNQP